MELWTIASTDIDELLNRTFVVTVWVCGILSLACAFIFPFLYHKYCNTKTIDKP